MPDLIRFSDLKDSHPLTLDGNNDLFAIAVKNPSSETGYTSQTVLPNQIAGYVAEDATYVNLKTGASDNTVVKAINKTLENFADEFNTTVGSTYAKDDCVIYDGILYQCTNVNGTTSGTFVTADWTQVKAVDVGAGGGASSLDDLGDVDIDSPQDKQVLLYDDANDEWVNGDNVAKSLAESIKTTEETPYQYRQTPITANRTLEKLIGVSCAFNQLNQASNNKTRTVAGVTFTNNNDGSVSVSGTCDTSDYYSIANTMSTVSGHKIYVFGVTSTNNYFITSNGSPTSQAGSNGVIINSSGSTEINLFMRAGAVLDITVYPQVIDLTAMFGSEVADYLYTLESNTAGSGIALFKQLFPEDYYAYQTATLISSKPTSKVVVGVNQWDGTKTDNVGVNANTGNTYASTGTFTTDYIKIIPDIQYYANPTNWKNWVCYYDENQTYLGYVNISNGLFIIPQGSYIRISGNMSEVSTASINLPSTDHSYHPYEEHTNPLGSDEIRGLLKVDNGQLVAYGDIHPSDGNGTEVFDIVDLGSLDWTYTSTSGHEKFTSVNALSNVKSVTASETANAVCDYYIVKSENDVYAHTQDKIVAIASSGKVQIWDSAYSDEQSFKNSLSGKYLIYEKATPTAKSYTPFTNPMLCGSTEEFTDSRSVKMFCGHQSQYYTETEGDKLSALPDVTGERGKFIIENKDGKMSLSPIKEITGTLTAGNTSITLSDASITTESTIDVYTDTFGINPTAVSVSAGAVTLTFAAQSSNVKVKVRIS